MRDEAVPLAERARRTAAVDGGERHLPDCPRRGRERRIEQRRADAGPPRGGRDEHAPRDAPVAPLRAVRPLEARHAGERAADVRAERDRAVEPLHERGEAKPGLRVAGRAEHGRRVAQRGETNRAATGRVRGGEPPGLE